MLVALAILESFLLYKLMRAEINLCCRTGTLNNVITGPTIDTSFRAMPIITSMSISGIFCRASWLRRENAGFRFEDLSCRSLLNPSFYTNSYRPFFYLFSAFAFNPTDPCFRLPQFDRFASNPSTGTSTSHRPDKIYINTARIDLRSSFFFFCAVCSFFFLIVSPLIYVLMGCSSVC